MEAAMVLTPTGPPPYFSSNGEHDLLIDFVEAVAVDFQQVEGGLRDAEVDVPGARTSRIIADAPEQPVRDAGSATAAAGDFLGAGLIDVEISRRAERSTMRR